MQMVKVIDGVRYHLTEVVEGMRRFGSVRVYKCVNAAQEQAGFVGIASDGHQGPLCKSASAAALRAFNCFANRIDRYNAMVARNNQR